MTEADTRYILSPAYDIYSLGVLVGELAMGDCLPKEKMVTRREKRELVPLDSEGRPMCVHPHVALFPSAPIRHYYGFSADTCAEIRRICTECTAADPNARPTAAAVHTRFVALIEAHAKV
jgi:hypothetical protein